MKPDASRHNPAPAYLRALIAATGQTQQAVADRLGVSLRSLRQYVAPIGKAHSPAPYGVQFMLESWVGQREASNAMAAATNSSIATTDHAQTA